MKIGSKALLVLGAVVIVAAIVVVGVLYFRQAGERDALNERVDVANARSVVLNASKQDLNDQLTSAQSSLEESRVKFPESVESIEYGEDFFKIAYGKDLHTMAAGCGVKLTSLTASPPTGKTVGAVTYSVSSFTVVVSGSTDNVLKFVDAIGTGIDYQLLWTFQLPWSVDVKSVNMDVGGSKATITLDIYGYKG